jgi:hypothetical protein
MPYSNAMSSELMDFFAKAKSTLREKLPGSSSQNGGSASSSSSSQPPGSAPISVSVSLPGPGAGEMPADAEGKSVQISRADLIALVQKLQKRLQNREAKLETMTKKMKQMADAKSQSYSTEPKVSLPAS